LVTFKSYIISLLFLVSLVFVSGYILLKATEVSLHFSDLTILALCFSVIALIPIYVFFRGRKKEPGSQTMHIFVGISIKILMEMALALVWFLIFKKNTMPSVLLFFVLYLAFSLLSIIYMLNALKDKSL